MTLMDPSLPPRLPRGSSTSSADLADLCLNYPTPFLHRWRLEADPPSCLFYWSLSSAPLWWSTDCYLATVNSNRTAMELHPIQDRINIKYLCLLCFNSSPIDKYGFVSRSGSVAYLSLGSSPIFSWSLSFEHRGDQCTVSDTQVFYPLDKSSCYFQWNTFNPLLQELI